MGQFYFSFLLISEILILYAFLSRLGIVLIEPAKLFLISFLIALVILGSHSVVRLHGDDYYSTFTVETFVFVSVSIILFTFGAALGAWRSQKFCQKITTIDCRDNSVVAMILASGSIAYILMVFESLISSPVSILGGASIFVLRQVANMQLADSDVGAGELLLSLSRTSLLLFLMLVVLLPRNIGAALKCTAALGIVAFVLETLSVGARSAIAFGPLFLGIAGALRLYRLEHTPGHGLNGSMLRSPLRLYHVIIITVLAYILFVAFPLSRNPGLEKNFEFFLAFTHPSEFGQWVEALSQVAFFGWVKPLAYGTSYLSMGVTKLSFFIEKTDLASLYSLGFYNGKIFVRLASIFDPHLYERWLEIRETIVIVMDRDGISGNPWRTMLGDLLLDFGIFGTPLVVFVIGYAFQWWFRVLMSSRDAASMTLAGVICATAGVSGFFGPFANNRLAYPLVLMSILLFFWRLAERAVLRTRIVTATHIDM